MKEVFTLYNAAMVNARKKIPAITAIMMTHNLSDREVISLSF